MCPLLGSLVEPEEEATVVYLGNRKGFWEEGMSEAEMGADGFHEAWEAGITEAERADICGVVVVTFPTVS